MLLTHDRKVFLFIGLLLCSLCVAFPPWAKSEAIFPRGSTPPPNMYGQAHLTIMQEAGAGVVIDSPDDYGPIWINDRQNSRHIDLTRLLLQLGAIACWTFALFWTAADAQKPA